MNTKVEELTYDDVLLDIINTVWWNDNVDVRNFLKHENNTRIRWFGLKDGNDFVAYMGVNPDAEIQIHDKTYPAYGGCYIWAKSGHGYGAELMNRVIELLRKSDDGGNRKAFQFIVDPTAKVSLVANYLKNFNETNGWKMIPIKNEFWRTVLFVKEFQS